MATSMSATSNTKSITYYSGNTNQEKSNYTAKYAARWPSTTPSTFTAH